MDIVSKEISIDAEGFSDIKNITEQVTNFAGESGFSEGIIHIFLLDQRPRFQRLNLSRHWFRI